MDFTPTFVAVKTNLTIDQYNRFNMWYGVYRVKDNEAVITEVVNDTSHSYYESSPYLIVEENKLTIKNWAHGERTVYWYAGAN